MVSEQSSSLDYGQQKLTIQQAINIGVDHHNAGRLSAAENFYNQILQAEPKQPVALHMLGVIAHQVGKNNTAIDQISKAITIKPDYAEAYGNLGLALKEVGRLDEAIESYRKAIEIKVGFAEAHNNLGAVLKGIGRLGEAVEHYRKAINIKPDYTEASFNLGHVLMEQGKHQDAIEAYQQSFASRTGIQPVGNKQLASATSALFLELTNKCNFHCDFCPSDSQKRAIGFMDLELAKKTYEEVAQNSLVEYVDLHLMGEPTLHPKLIEILNFAYSINVKTEMVTNGSTLVAKFIPKILEALYGTIVVSHMTPTEETYHFRGKVGLSWDRYIDNIRLLIRKYLKRLAKGESLKNNIELRVMITRNSPTSNVNILETFDDARAILAEWCDFTASVERELALPPFERQESEADALMQQGYHAFKKFQLQRGIVLTFWNASTYANSRVNDDYDLLATEKAAFCPHPFKDLGVLWNGDVTLCCLDYGGQLKVGNVRESSIESVLQSEAANKLRASMLGHHPLPPLCRKCQARPIKRKNYIAEKRYAENALLLKIVLYALIFPSKIGVNGMTCSCEMRSILR